MFKKAYFSALALLAVFFLLPSTAWTQAEILYQNELGLPDRAAFSPEVAVSGSGEVYVVFLDRPDPTAPPPKRKHGEHRSVDRSFRRRRVQFSGTVHGQP